MTSQAVFGLDNKAALIVGGGQGMGEATALALAQAGCDIVVLDSVAERAETVAGQVRALGRQAAVVVADILDEDQAVAAVAEAVRTFAHLEKLVTIVGSAVWGSLFDIDMATWNRDHDVNLRYVFVVARAFARSLVERERPGTITCISSIDGMMASPNHAAYGVAKAGLNSLVQSMAVEWALHGIRVNAIAPGTIATPRLANKPERQKDDLVVPMRRRGTPAEIGNAALFLSSELASYVTGEILVVDGGLMAANILHPQTAQ